MATIRYIDFKSLVAREMERQNSKKKELIESSKRFLFPCIQTQKH